MNDPMFGVVNMQVCGLLLVFVGFGRLCYINLFGFNLKKKSPGWIGVGVGSGPAGQVWG